MSRLTRRAARSSALALALAACTTERRAPADSAAVALQSAERDTAPAPRAADAPVGAWTVSERGFGPVRAGMTLADAGALVPSGLTAPAGAAACGYAAWTAAPSGVHLMVEGGRIARVEVSGGPTATEAGARVGDAEARVDSLYAGRVTRTPGKYAAGSHVLTVTPEAPADSGYRLVFETDGRVVTRYRAGRRPAVEYVEACG